MKRAAERNHRSLNGEMLARLQASATPRTVDVDTLLRRIRARRARTGAQELNEPLLRTLKNAGRP